MKKKIEKTVFAALCISLGMLLPLLTTQIKEIGDTLLPMHIPVMVCGVICGWNYGLIVGGCLPFFRSAVFGMPAMYPNAVWMAFELATYGFIIGLIYNKSHKKNLAALYFSLITAMVLGRVVWGIAKAIILGLSSKPFTAVMFISGGFVDAIPGIILQLILVPIIVKIIERNIQK